MGGRALVLTGVLLAGCGSNVTPGDLGADLAAPVDLSMPDLGAPDQATSDLAMADLAMPDLAMPDQAMPDLFSCTPGDFVACAGNDALYCNGTGDGTTAVECGATCLGPTSCGQCTPGAPDSCDGAMLVSCDAQGRKSTVTCALGCVAVVGDADAGVSPSAHCGNLQPSNGLTADCVSKGATLALDVAAPTTIDPTTGEINGVSAGAAYQKITPTGGRAIGVFHLSRLTIAAGQTLKVTCPSAQTDPTQQTALALVIDGDVSIDGTIDIAAHLMDGTAGCGATINRGDGTQGTDDTGTQTPLGTGGGGGSYGSKGANGAASATTFVFGRAGNTFGANTVAPLYGGARGGASDSAVGAARAQGGGALQIDACGSITVGTGGLINAGGGGAPASASPAGGGGGGSGGAILLEAPSVTVGGLVATNGGTGGGGAAGTASATAGVDGVTDPNCASNQGGAGVIDPLGTGGTGGAGACGNTDATAGQKGTAASAGVVVGNGGGGGGGGRIRINTAMGTLPTVTGTISPRLTTVYSTGTISVQ